MRCEELEIRLNEALDSRKRPEWDPELRLHCEACAPCRDTAASYGLLLDGLHALTIPEPADDFSCRVVDSVVASPLSGNRTSLVAAVLAVAASMLLVIVPLLPSRRAEYVYNPPPTARLESLAASSAGQYYWSRLVALPLVGPVLIAMTDNDASTDPYAEMAKGTGQGLAVVVLYMPPINGPRMMAARPSLSERSAMPSAIRMTLLPVRTLFGEAVTLLWHSFAGSTVVPATSEQPAA